MNPALGNSLPPAPTCLVLVCLLSKQGIYYVNTRCFRGKKKKFRIKNSKRAKNLVFLFKVLVALDSMFCFVFFCFCIFVHFRSNCKEDINPLLVLLFSNIFPFSRLSFCFVYGLLCYTKAFKFN